MEPITTVIAGAIAMGAGAGIEPTFAQAVKDAYAGLKRMIQDSCGDNGDVVDAVDDVSKRPEAEGRRAELDEALRAAGDSGTGVRIGEADIAGTASFSNLGGAGRPK